MSDATPDDTTSEGGFSAFEKAALKERAAEVRAERTAGKGSAKIARELATMLETIAEMDDGDRALAARVHEIVTRVVPEATAKLRYGMPTYYLDGAVLCFVQVSGKFDTRYSTFAFEERAAIDEGTMWPTSFAITTLSDDDATLIEALVRRAVA